MKNLFCLLLAICFVAFSASEESRAEIVDTQSNYFIKVETNRARYSPGDTVKFTTALNSIPSNAILQIKYYHLNDDIYEQTVEPASSLTFAWNWVVPSKDYQGYLVVILLVQNNQLLDKETIAVDVSSDWKYFPRYGFLSSYPQLSSDSIKSVIAALNRYHINGLQFYDWQYKHNMPLKGTPDNPATYWNDIANRTVYFSTVKNYIDEAHHYNMKAMNYNLLYGAYSNAYQDGVNLDAWGLYKDPDHQTRFMYTLPSGWASNLYFMDPSNKQWQAYIINQEKKVFQALPFDGWHVDQVGDNGVMYNYQGQQVYLKDTFYGFLQAAKDSLKVDLVMNAVNQYGQPGIAASPVDFLYTEVWDPNNSFSDLVYQISRNSLLSNNKLSMVLAAYVNYNLADHSGYFNTPGVLLLDAVIFSSGASHIELGEHMLGKEYFPNNNLAMTEDLKSQLVHYYDFMTAYENLLRDSLTLKQIDIKSNSAIKLSIWPPAQGTVWYFPKEKGSMQIINFINFVNANSMQWRDADGTQKEPGTLSDISLTVPVNSEVKNVWLASPDFDDCAPSDISFTQDNGTVTFSLPKLKYWDMVVIEYSHGTSSIENKPNGNSTVFNYSLGQNYPNPFNPETIIPFKMKMTGNARFTVFNILGKAIFDKTLSAGEGDNTFLFNGSELESGIYFYRLKAPGFIQTKKMCLLK